MTWFGATAWAESLSYGGFSDWRLPSASFCYGFFPECDSELTSLFSNPSVLTNFSNIQPYFYYSNTEYDDSRTIYIINMNPAASGGDAYGLQSGFWKNDPALALAVRDGDVAASDFPFAAFTPSGSLKLKPGASDDSFTAKGGFTLSATTDGINPVMEGARLNIGTYAVSVPSGFFKRNKTTGAYNYSGILAGVTIKINIVPTASGVYTFTASGINADLTNTKLPLEVGLTIGNDGGNASLGTATVTAAP